jgi:hypothetical protein
MAISREWAALLCLWSLAALSCLLGVVARPSFEYLDGNADQLLDLVRVLCATALALALLLGPGLLWRAAGDSRRPSLGFLPLPGWRSWSRPAGWPGRWRARSSPGSPASSSSARYWLNDVVALIAMFGFAAALAWLVWLTTPERLPRS